jgi:hypothetical protein
MPTNVGAFKVFGAIEQKWLQVGGVGGLLGAPLSNESPTFDGLGRAQTFKGGVVSWHPTIGAHEVHGAILARWLDAGREQFGHPITDESTCPDGRGKFNHFRALQFHQEPPPESSIYWSPETGPHDVFGAIRDKWASLGFERSPLGFPVASARDQRGGAIQHFQGGVITWTPSGGPVDHVPGDTIQFDSGQVNVPGALPLNGNIGLGIQRDGSFTFNTHVHDSGLGSIEYAMAATLVTSAGSVFEFVHQGTVDGLGSNRLDDLSTANQNPALATAFEDILTSGRLRPALTGTDNLVKAIGDLVAEAGKELAAAGVKALVTVIVG